MLLTVQHVAISLFLSMFAVCQQQQQEEHLSRPALSSAGSSGLVPLTSQADMDQKSEAVTHRATSDGGTFLLVISASLYRHS